MRGTAINAVNAPYAFNDGSGLDLFVAGGPSLLRQGEGEEESSAGYIARGRMVPQDPNDPDHCNIWDWTWTNAADPNDPSAPVPLR